MSDYKLSTEDEETALIEEVSDGMFVAMGMVSTPMPLILDEFAKLSFQINSDIFGGKLENVEKWLQERIGRAEQEKEEDQARQMSRFLTDFPTATMH